MQPMPLPLPHLHAGFSGALHGLRDSVRDRVAALGWLDYDAGDGATHANLPSDLFIVTVQLAEPIAPELQVVVTPVREQARRYGVARHSQIAVATLTASGMFSLFGTVWHGLEDRPVPLAALCSSTRVRQLQAALRGSNGLDARTAAFGRWIEAGLLESGPLSQPDARVARTALRLSHGAAHATDTLALARLEGVTRRQLERDFRSRLGLSPGAFARVARFQRAAAAVSAGASIADSAALHGYADQAHLTRSFKLYSGLTPRELAQQGARPGRELLRAGLAGRVCLLDLPAPGATALALAPAQVAHVQDRHPPAMAKWAA
jgi:AraC-like DNA-binding protein